MSKRTRPQGATNGQQYDTPTAHARRSSGKPRNVATPEQTYLYSIDELSQLLYTFACRDDGWLRFMPSGDEKQLYLKWKFTRGRFSGHYCFVSGEPHQYTKLLSTLHNRIDECYNNISKPTRDTAWNA